MAKSSPGEGHSAEGQPISSTESTSEYTAVLDADSLSEIIDAAADIDFEDSEEETPEEQPEEVEEDSEEAEEEDPVESDEDDEDSLDEDDEESEEEDDDEDEDDDSEVVALADDETVQLSDGTELTGKELREGYLRLADYTKKTQEVADERRKVQDAYQKLERWYQDRTQNPGAWAAEIAYGTNSPGETLASAMRESGDATALFGDVVKALVENGDLDEKVVEVLNLTELAEQAKDQGLHREVQALKQQLQERDQLQQQSQTQQQVQQQLLNEWSEIVSEHDLSFDSTQAQQQGFMDLLQFAYNNGIPSLKTAYAAQAFQKGSTSKQKQSKQTPKKRKQAESAVKKRKTAAMSRKPTGGGAPPSESDDDGDLFTGAVTKALENLGFDS